MQGAEKAKTIVFGEVSAKKGLTIACQPFIHIILKETKSA